jgi:hypothetical protein
MSVQLLITLLIHVSCAIDRRPPPGDVLLDVALHTLAVRLSADYLAVGRRMATARLGFGSGSTSAGQLHQPRSLNFVFTLVFMLLSRWAAKLCSDE